MIIDGHVHFDGIKLADKMLADQARTGAEQFNILDVGWTDPTGFDSVLANALWFKNRMPEKVFVFGGLDYSGLYDRGHVQPDIPFPEQLERLRAVGCDGLKLLIGKPDRRQWLKQPLDGPAYEPMFQWLGNTGFPVLWHVADPPEFWDPEAVPLWAKKQRWWYDSTFPSKELIDREVANVLARHPQLHLILPHFFFLSDNLPAAGRFLEKYPAYSFDLAPGVEMLHNFTANHAAAREFIIQHSDRIIFGTDTGMMKHSNGPKRGWMLRHFLESDEVFDVPEDPCMTPDERPALHGLALPKETLERIFAGNFQRFVRAKMPRKLDQALAKEILRDLAAQYRRRGSPANFADEALADF